MTCRDCSPVRASLDYLLFGVGYLVVGCTHGTDAEDE